MTTETVKEIGKYLIDISKITIGGFILINKETAEND